jgi:hypothetical protein
MSSDSIRFPSLNHTNYAEWVLRMEAILIRGGFWELVIGGEVLDANEVDEKKKRAFAQRQAQCRAEMVLRVDDSQLPHMADSDPKSIWNALASVHRARGFGSRLQLRRLFITATMKKDQSMEGWIGEVRSRSNRLKAIDVTVSDEDIIVVLTAGLPPSYTPVIISLDAVKASELTLDFVITRLLNEEGRQVISSEPDVEVKKEEPDNAAMLSARSVQCFYCLEKGHFASVCPQKTKDVKEREDKGRRQVTKDAYFAATAACESDEENFAM